MDTVMSKRSIALIYFALILCEFTAAMELSMVYTALPTLMKAFPDSPNVTWVVTIHFLVYASAAALCGRLGDLYGLKRMLLVVLAIALTGSLISAFSTNLATLIFGRGLQGVSGAIVPLAYGLVRMVMPKERVAFAVSIVAMAATVMGSMGLLIGGVLIDHFPWHTLFFLSATLAAIAIVAALLFLPSTKPQATTGSFDLLGGILFVPGVTGVLFAVIKAKSAGWADPVTLGILSCSVLVLIVWAVHEIRHASPMIDIRLMARRQIGLGDISMMLLALGALQHTQVLPIILQQPEWTGIGFGLTATLTGLMQLPIMFIYLCGGPWSGRLATKYGARHATLVGAGLISIGWVAIALHHSNLVFIMTMDYVQALGMAVLYASIPNVIVEDAPASRVSEATGVLSVIRAVSLAIGSQLVALALTTAIIVDPAKGAGKYPGASAYSLAFGGMAIACLLLFVVAYALPRRGRTVTAEVDEGIAKRVSARG